MCPTGGAAGVFSACPWDGARSAGCSDGMALSSSVGIRLRFVLRVAVVDVALVGGSVIGFVRLAFFCNWHGGLKCCRD